MLIHRQSSVKFLFVVARTRLEHGSLITASLVNHNRVSDYEQRFCLMKDNDLNDRL